MTAQIILKDENGNFATIDNLSDWDLFRLINVTLLAEKNRGESSYYCSAGMPSIPRWRI